MADPKDVATCSRSSTSPYYAAECLPNRQHIDDKLDQIKKNNDNSYDNNNQKIKKNKMRRI
jgi:hypothetical protein